MNELPPLPEPGTRTDDHIEGCGDPAYTAEQMQAYAQQAVELEREACLAECAKRRHTGDAGVVCVEEAIRARSKA